MDLAVLVHPAVDLRANSRTGSEEEEQQEGDRYPSVHTRNLKRRRRFVQPRRMRYHYPRPDASSGIRARGSYTL
ncbi:MAG: hypothetical protein U5L11_10980 [Arhodomonas sp.]|nr:hypothetical protein [Arhodomonas sp.]